jgi:hypothetical protein
MIVIVEDSPEFEIPIVTLIGTLKIRINPLKANQRQSLNGFKGIFMVNLTKSRVVWVLATTAAIN